MKRDARALWNLDEKWCGSTEDSHFLRKFHHASQRADVYSWQLARSKFKKFKILVFSSHTHLFYFRRQWLINWGCMDYCQVRFAWFLKYPFWGTHIAVHGSTLCKKLHLCSADKRKSYTSGMARGGVFGWSIPLTREPFWLVKSCPTNSTEIIRWNSLQKTD